MWRDGGGGNGEFVEGVRTVYLGGGGGSGVRSGLRSGVGWGVHASSRIVIAG